LAPLVSKQGMGLSTLWRYIALVAAGLFTIFLVVSLLSFDPADPPYPSTFPGHAQPRNACGYVGAYVAWFLRWHAGITAYLLALILAVWIFRVAAGKTIGWFEVRVVGLLLAIAGFSGLATVVGIPWWGGPPIGPGGYLGAILHLWIQSGLGWLGTLLFFFACSVCGLLLAADWFALQVARWAIVFPSRLIARILSRAFMEQSSTVGSADEPAGVEKEKLRRASASGDSAAGSSSGLVVVRMPASSGGNPGEIAEGRGMEKEGPQSEPDSRGLPPAKPQPSTPKIRKPRSNEREEIRAEIEADARTLSPSDYCLPSIDLLLPGEPFSFEEHERDVRQKAAILEKTFADFGYHVRVVEIQTGPVIAQFEVELEAGLRVSRIMALADDLAIALRVPSVRIVAPIPGKNTVAIEVPNAQRQIVRLREVMEEAEGLTHSMRIPVFLGKDVAGNPIVIDLTSLPHLLIAGRTGTGKSVCLNAIIMSILMCRRPDEVRMLLIDPKMVELSPYKQIPHLMHPVVTDMRKAEAILAWAVDKMEERYHLLARAGVRHLSVYNQLGEEELRDRLGPLSEEEWAAIPRRMPYMVMVADEMADLMMTAAKEVEAHIIRLAQKSRAVGIHLVLATQKPTVDVITGLIKSNLPARICFEVSSRVDSRVVLDEMGAERLLGNGDMLFLRPGTSTLIRGQGTFVSDDEIARVIAAVATTEPDYVAELVDLRPTALADGAESFKHRDELYEAAVEIVVREGRGSVSLLQRALGIGYGRAARLIDYMAEDGIVGPYNGSQARDVLISIEQWEERRGRQQGPRPEPREQRRPGRILLRGESEGNSTPGKAGDEIDSSPHRRETPAGWPSPGSNASSPPVSSGTEESMGEKMGEKKDELPRRPHLPPAFRPGSADPPFLN